MIIGRSIDDPGQVWLDTLQRVATLVIDLDGDRLAAPVAAAEDRTVPEILGLLVTLVDDALAGSVHGLFDAAPADAATADAAAGTVPESLGRLRERAPEVAELVRTEPDAMRLVAELASAEHDLRTALEQHGERDDDAVLLSIEYLTGVLARRLAGAGLPGLRITCEQWGYDTSDTCTEILVADRFELFRALSGRRSANEAGRWMWSDSAEPYLPYLAVWGSMRATDLDEIDPSIPPEYAAKLRSKSWREPIPT